MNSSTQKKLTANINKLYFFESLFMGFGFVVPIIVLFWQENGLNYTEIMILQSLFSLMMVLIEVPSGYIADIIGRKKALILASIIGIIGISIYSIGYTFYGFLLAEFLWAIALSLKSGADDALLYDSLLELKKEKDFQKIQGKKVYYNMLYIAFACIVGGFIGSYDYRYTFYLGIFFMLFIIPITFSLHEPERHKLIITQGYGKKLLIILKEALIKNFKLRWIIIFGGIVFTFNNIWILYQPYFELNHIDTKFIGVLFAALNISAAIFAKYSHAIENYFGQKKSLIFIVLILGLSHFLLANIVTMLSFIFMFIHQFIRSFRRVVITDYVNKLTKSDIRATVLSINQMVSNLMYAAFIPFLGVITDTWGLLTAFNILGVCTLVFGGIILLVLLKNNS